MLFRQKTKISKGNSNNNSVRTSVPANIAQILKIKAGDSIEWTVDSTNDKITITVTKAE
ncbi:MAG: AbrB/MazE/SpoVT family DNA-binding domain-containing protein [Methanobrevibacter sp.]|nr:AbrB/MazE/SpoVT family DNA-binding domain-containing protein [Methanobrevibacter sp.]